MNTLPNVNRVRDAHMASANRLLDAKKNSMTTRRAMQRLNTISVIKKRREDSLIAIYEPADLLSELDKSTTPERKAVLKAMKGEKHKKPLALVTDSIISALSGLKETFPNFSEVIDLYSMAMRLNLVSGVKEVSLRPLLLVGEPGVGKTRFLTELGNVLKTGFFSIDMSRVSAGFVLSGSDSTWGSGKPGFISDSLRESNVANPLILVDEIDKVGGDSRYDPTASFYALLEQHTARQFSDEFLKIPMDCSRINWVASANYPERIEPAILSRMKVVQINMPTPEETVLIVRHVYSELLTRKSWRKLFASELSEPVVKKLENISPRMIIQVLETACYQAFNRGGDAGKKKCVLTADDILLPERNQKSRIGFIQE